jgi:uncharacterized protein (TIGR02147 family)
MSIFEHTDYRQFLQDYYTRSKERNPSFSYGVFARQAGFKSKGVLHRIVAGKRALSKNALYNISQAMHLDDKAFAYFQQMVAFCHAKDAKEKAFFFHKLVEANPLSLAKQMQADHYEFFSQWYNSTLRELLPLIRFKGDYGQLGKMLNPPVSATQTKKAVALLMRLGLIEKTKVGFRQGHRAITSGEDVQALALRDFHKKNLALASRSIDSVPRKERDLSCLVVAISEPGLEIVKKEIQICRQRIARLTDEMGNAARVYHLNFQLYPTTVDIQSKVTP